MMTAGHVGAPNPACEVVLVDVPEMGYLHTDKDHKGQPCQGRGEIWVRGPVVFKEYYKEPEKTRETVDEEGWLHSGDIGLWTREGNLQIVDRKKNIFKLSQGGAYEPISKFKSTVDWKKIITFFFFSQMCVEYVAPEKIENIVIQSLIIAQAFVYGDSFQSALVAIIVPDEEALRSTLAGRDDLVSLSKASLGELCRNQKINAFVINEILKVAKKNGLHGFETPRAIHLDPEPFSVEGGLLTPTFKLKRQQARDKYETQIEAMYASMPKPKSRI
jgi:long-chain acyl-CoA synthetase